MENQHAGAYNAAIKCKESDHNSPCELVHQLDRDYHIILSQTEMIKC